MTSEILIRPYEPRDRGAVRSICCDTAFQGGPVDPLFHDREVAADLLTSYYTDYEPEAIWAAEHEGRVVGYLTGCLNSRRYFRIMTWCIVPKAVIRAIRCGLFLSVQTWKLLGSGTVLFLSGGFRHDIPQSICAGHLHVSLRKEFRGQKVGHRLVEQFCKQARAAGLQGIYASVRKENHPARHFFERLGFTALSPPSKVTVIYGKHL